MEEENILDDHEMELFSDFLNLTEDRKTFILEADGETFSREDIDKVFTELRMFVSARIMRSWDENERSPKKVEIQINLDLT